MIRLREVWRRKILWPFWSMAGLALALGVAAYRGQRSTIVIYNQGAESLLQVEIRAAGQSYSIPELGPDRSRRWRLGRSGQPSGLHLYWLDGPEGGWDGGLVDPLGADRLTIRIYSDGWVVQDQQRSIWAWP